MIRRRGFDQPQEAIELSPGHRQPLRVQRLNHGIEVRLGLPRGLRTQLAEGLEIPERAVGLAEGQPHVGELKPHGEIGRGALEYLAEAHRVALLAAVSALALELGKRVQRSWICCERRQQLVGLRRPIGEGIELREG